jgi:hypothetical protein
MSTELSEQGWKTIAAVARNGFALFFTCTTEQEHNRRIAKLRFSEKTYNLRTRKYPC